MTQEATIQEKNSSTLRTGPPSLEDGSAILAWNILLQAINDYLCPPSTPMEIQEIEPQYWHVVSCDCEPCPLELWMVNEEEVDAIWLGSCKRLQFLRTLPQWSAEAWFKSSNDCPYSYHWICTLFGVNPDYLLERIMRMPRGKRLTTAEGQRLYRHNRTSYDVANQRMRSKDKKVDEERLFNFACAAGMMEML